MDLIKSGSYIDIFYAKTCATTKISTVSRYHVVLATLLLFKSLGLSAPEEACSRNVRASGTLKFGYEGIFKIL